MMLSVVGPGFSINSALVTNAECAVAHGKYTLNAPDNQEEVEYGITLWMPKDCPKFPPTMFCNDPKLPMSDLDRHILKNGQACLEVRPEIRKRWPPGSKIVDFLNNLVDPFLAWQVYFDAFGQPPPWGQRSHGITGIIEYYAELMGRSADETIIGFMKLLARKNRPKGHEPCPCESGKKLRSCHRDLLYKMRECIPWQIVGQELKTIKSFQDSPKSREDCTDETS